jgi:hypothetical protein
VEIDFQQTEESAEVSRLKGELLAAVWMARDLLAKPPVRVIGCRSATASKASKKTFSRTKVVTMRDVAAFELVLVPVVKGLEAVVTKTGGKTSAVAVDMTRHKMITPVGGGAAIEDVMTLYLIPMAVQTEGKDRFMPPFWCVKQASRDDANMAMDEVELDGIFSILSSDETRSNVRPAKNDTAKWSVPVMTNIKALPEGTELVFPKASAPEKESTPKQKTWLSNATMEFKAACAKEGKGVRGVKNCG